MEIIPDSYTRQQIIQEAIRNCKELLGSENVYSIKALKELKQKYDDMAKFLLYDFENYGDKLFKNTTEFHLYLSAITQLMEINAISETKGFDFTDQQIEKAVNVRSEF